jgi:hypothetical protein
MAAAAAKREDPGHATAFCFTPWHKLETIGQYGDCGDVIIVDPYVHAPYMGLVPKAVDGARQAAGPDRPVWSIIWAAQDAGQAPPDAAATRCATYLSLIHGATGIFYYGHKGEPGKQGPSPGHEAEGWQRGVGEPELGYLAETIAQLGAEVRFLAPALLAPVAQPQVTVDPRDTIHLRQVRLGERSLVLAANISEQPVMATFHLTGQLKARSVRVAFEQRQLQVADGRFADQFAPLATHVYELVN